MSWMITDEEIDSGGLAAPGRYLAEIFRVEQKRSNKNNEAMGNIEIIEVGSGNFLCYDILMLEGKGAGIGAKKALAIGCASRVDGGISIEDVPNWKGHRFVITLVEGEWNNKKRMEPNFEAEGFGYAPEDTWESGSASGVAPAADSAPEADDDIPF